ncbi:hypothetical protein EMIHUDRAFT_217054 [Emiliania huxleyi CCMP1516]|uniref:Peptidase M28 domain-containing protein n=2 Tax=Emiliania huxleyi TaxID=2903 RepID=A0A0D3IC12_EMIH1|nr:hypothetical protein EMIHUDRAFT_217054 [Emiliania huxleyi CCMP1516]EOD08797.1 hypothetical protein EMIHUDRAFT_217054 [Emiliania huxleyi CCMP1516]|eukprot:XP_005761226.1 hypothetical protein EMIHUDRAFT_217054 [Emiliania huxleyi CCMP1516]
MARATRVSAPRKALLLAGAILACLAHNLVLAPLVHAAPSAAAAPGFDTAEAQRLLLALCVGGPRIAGSQAASAAVALLLRELGAVSELARAAGATLEFEAVDSGHGSFETDFLDGFTNSYQGVVSVAARLTWPGAAREAVLLSSHFDTWSSSPGASDDAVHVATTVGVLRALAAGPARGVSVLAFFSGAEESNWVAAHAFATRHRWAADYRAVLNLEAIGAGGDLVAFQMGPRAGWLASALGDAGTQRGSVFAHDLFQIPGFPAGDDFKTLTVDGPSDVVYFDLYGLAWVTYSASTGACGLGSAYLPAYYLGVNGAALLGAAVLIAVLLPITARSGAVLPTDPLVAVVYAVTAVCTSSVLVAPLPRRVAARSAGGLGLVAVCCVCFALGSRASPFTDATPKRLVVQHIYRELEGAPHSSGLWVSAFDFSGLRELRETPAAAALLPAGAVFATTVAGRSVKPPPIPQRKRRLHFAFLTCGSGGGAEPCLWDLTLVVNGSAPLPLAVTGHYPDIADTPELEALSEALPTELRADWHWFSSMVQRVDLPVGGAETVAYS